jgi:hypothetical protein
MRAEGSKLRSKTIDLGEFVILNLSKSVIEARDLVEFIIWKNLLAEKKKQKN